ncbi:MAG: Trm112 family protein [Gemmatimonadaceae bacterium]
MFVELLEKLRCPNDHEPSPLIATASRTVDRHIVEGTLGCPVCHAEFPVSEGVVRLGESFIAPMITADVLSRDRMLRVGALLGLDDRGGLYLLDCISAYFIEELAELSPQSRFIALSGTADFLGASGVIAGHGDRIPLAESCVRGIVLDLATPALLGSAVKALAPGGRLVAPATADVPEGIEILARDEANWVGEREAMPALSKLHRAPRSSP